MDALLYLREIANTNSINKAAEHFYISKSAFLAALNGLEQELGVSLFERSVHGTKLTEIGQTVLQHAETILQEAEELERICKEYVIRDNIVNFYVGQAVSYSVFPYIMAELQRQLPNIWFFSKTLPLIEDVLLKVNASKDNVGLVMNYIKIDEAILKKYPNIVVKYIRYYDTKLAVAKKSKYIAENVTEVSLQDIESLPKVELYNARYPYGSVEHNYVLGTDNRDVRDQAIINDSVVGLVLDLNLPNNGLGYELPIRYIPIKENTGMALYFVYNIRLPEQVAKKYEDIIQRACDLK